MMGDEPMDLEPVGEGGRRNRPEASTPQQSNRRKIGNISDIPEGGFIPEPYGGPPKSQVTEPPESKSFTPATKEEIEKESGSITLEPMATETGPEPVPSESESLEPEPALPELEMTEGTLQGEFLLPLAKKDDTPHEDIKTVKKGGIMRKEIVDNKTFIQHYLYCPYDTKSGGLKGGNYMDKISEKFGLKEFKSDIKIDRPDFSQPDKTSQECKYAKMVVDKEELIYEPGPRARPMRPNRAPALCYMTGFPIDKGSGTEADGYHCEHYLIIGDIGNSLRLALKEYENILKKMVDKTKFEEFQGLSKKLWKEVYKPSQPPSNLLKADYIFVNLNHKDLSVSVNYHNIIRMMVTLVFGHLNNNSHSIHFREKFLEDIMRGWGSEEAYLHARVQFLFEQAEQFCKLWGEEMKAGDKMYINSSASVLTTIRYLHMKKKEQLDKISGKKPSSTAMKSITGFLKMKVGVNSVNFLKKRLAKALCVFDNFAKAAEKIVSSGKVPLIMHGGASDDASDDSFVSTPPPDASFLYSKSETMDDSTPPSKMSGHELKRRTTAPTEFTIKMIGGIEDSKILQILINGEMVGDDYDKLSKEVKTELVREAIETTKLEYGELYHIYDEKFVLNELLDDITALILEGNNPPVRFDESRYRAHRELLNELYESNEELLNDIIDIPPESIYSEKPSIDFLMSEEMIEYNELLETARAILSPEMGEPEPEMEISETGTPEKGRKKKTKKKQKTKKKRKSTKRKTTKKSRRKKKRKTIRKKKKQSDLIDKIIDRLGY